ncbi:MAG: hypothetical protein K8L91_08085, partial [Anaerolineae bacterium]|nr:hypothetical protein [Anaerolineae bacterium]
LGMLNPFIGWCGGRGTSKLQEWAWLLTAHNQVFDFIVGATVQGAVYGAIGGVIAAIDPYIGLLMLTMGVAEAIHWLFSTYTEPGDQICATVAGAGAAIVGIATSWTFTTGWDNWSNGRGKPGLGGEGPDGRPNNTGGGPELGGGPNDGSGGPYDPPSGGTPGDEGNPEWPTGGGLDDSDQHPTNGGLDDTEQHPTGGGDDDGRPGLGGVGNHFCSFSEDTPVATEDGQTLIGDLELGDKVLAYNEETGELEYQEVTAVWEHYDDVLLLTIDDETLETTTDHPFYTDQGEWVAAGDLEVGMHVRKSDGTYGEVEAIEQTETTQPMFNLTVDEVHTYFVGDEQWLVHNFCSRQVPYNDTGLSGDARLFRRTSPDGYRQRDVAVYVYDETQVKIFMSDPTAQTYGKGHAEQLGKQWFEKNLIDPSRIDALYTELEPCKNCQSVLTGWLPDDFEVTYSFKHPGEKAAWERAIAENWGNR